jgi:hypothetical protein
VPPREDFFDSGERASLASPLLYIVNNAHGHKHLRLFLMGGAHCP